jgi:hypothetical protein
MRKSVARKFIALGMSEKLTVLRAATVLIAVRAVFVVLPFASALRVIERVARLRRGPSAPSGVSRTVWAVERVGTRLFPRNPCLTNAYAVHLLLRRRGHPTVLRIGVRRGEQREPKAHAWVECGGDVLIGGPDSKAEYVPLPDLSAVRGGYRGVATRAN